jgi:hypothetical protein
MIYLGLAGAVLGVIARVLYGYWALSAGQAFNVKYLRAPMIGALLAMAQSFSISMLHPAADWQSTLTNGIITGFGWAAAIQIAVSAKDRKAVGK